MTFWNWAGFFGCVLLKCKQKIDEKINPILNIRRLPAFSQCRMQIKFFSINFKILIFFYFAKSLFFGKYRSSNWNSRLSSTFPIFLTLCTIFKTSPLSLVHRKIKYFPRIGPKKGAEGSKLSLETFSSNVNPVYKICFFLFAFTILLAKIRKNANFHRTMHTLQTF